MSEPDDKIEGWSEGADGAAFEADLPVLRRNTTLAWLFMLGVAVAAMLVASEFLGHEVVGVFWPAQILVLLLISKRRVDQNWRARRANARVAASRDGVHLDGRLVAPASRIVEAYYQPSLSGEDLVRFVDKRRDVLLDVVVSGEAQAREILKATGRDAAASRARFDALSPLVSSAARQYGAMAFVLLVVFGGMAGVQSAGFPEAITPFVILGAVLPILVLQLRSRVDVGADGVLITWLGRRRFFAYDDLREVAPVRLHGIRFELASGKSVHVQVEREGHRGDDENSTPRRDALLARVNAALEAHRAGIAAREVAERLARSGRDRETWQRDLVALVSGEGGYRSAAIRDDDLWRVLEDAGAPADARAAAAMLLRRSREPDVGARLRVAADATASPKLRVALEAAADGSDDDALAPFCEEGAKVARLG